MSPACWFGIYSRATRVVLAACLVAVAGPVAAQSILQFDQWMQKIDRRSQSIQRHLTARESAAAQADAREVGELYQLMEDYFIRRGSNSEDAVKFSRDGAELADAVVKLLQLNDFDGASRSVASITHACRDCHIKYKPLDP